MDAIVALINSSSDKVGFVGGVLFLLVVVFCEKPVVLGSVKLPAIDTVGRVISGIFGTILISWALFVWSAQSNVGIFSHEPPPNSIVVKQGQPKQARLSTGDSIGVYAYNITSKGTADIVLFELNGFPQNLLNKDISYSKLTQTLGSSSIIWRQTVRQGVTNQFTRNNHQHTLKVDRIDWFLIGSNYVVVSVN